MPCWKIKNHQNNEEIDKDENEIVTKQSKENTIQVIIDNIESNKRTIKSSPIICCVSHITDHLLLSSATASDQSTLDYFKVTCVINSAAELPDLPFKNSANFKYVKISIYDDPKTDILSNLDFTSDLIHKEATNNGRVLVHCVAGISRSATICIAYLMKYEKRSLLEAYKHVKARRPIVKPNCGFFRQLIAYETSLFGTTTVKMVYNDTVKMEIPDVYNDDYKNIMQFRRKLGIDKIRRH